MTQAELNRAVAEATGESVREIAHRGFVPWTPTLQEIENVDWDDLQSDRRVAMFQQPCA